MSQSEVPADTQYGGLLRAMPVVFRPFALLARFDRPIGWWLLFWPCVYGVGLSGGFPGSLSLILLMLIGAIAMRGAGCVYNDIVDRDLDRQVARTALRPLASGSTSVKRAWLWLGLLCLIGLSVLLRLNQPAQITALISLALVAAYPFMKRITWWPQAWLGLVFSWGALVGWMSVAGFADSSMWMLYGGTICWVIGYDTIYALQDREDDALIGVRSSARALGDKVRDGVAVFYGLALAFWGTAIFLIRPQFIAVLALLPAALHLIWQVTSLVPDDPDDPVYKFRSNHFAGFLVAVAMIIVGSTA